MGKLVVSEFITLDGVFEAPGGGEEFELGGWAFKFDRGDDGNGYKFTELMAADALLLGRATYSGFASAWPKMGGNEFGDKMNSMPKYVVSTTLSDEAAGWTNSTVIRGELAGEVAELKARLAGDILVAGSARLIASLAEHDLVDEYRLMVFPTVLGAGRRLFDGWRAPATLRLTGTTPLGPDGIVVLAYEPVRTGA